MKQKIMSDRQIKQAKGIMSLMSDFMLHLEMMDKTVKLIPFCQNNNKLLRKKLSRKLEDMIRAAEKLRVELLKEENQ